MADQNGIKCVGEKFVSTNEIGEPEEVMAPKCYWSVQLYCCMLVDHILKKDGPLFETFALRWWALSHASS